ncbi:hypothetical protein [Nocardia sp. NPDC051463]|uniref:hypothetical protein n=1 Tax=Nocardia sp. NPDC051463 TaxID=3154845 RepID=UPI003447AAC5
MREMILVPTSFKTLSPKSIKWTSQFWRKVTAWSRGRFRWTCPDVMIQRRCARAPFGKVIYVVAQHISMISVHNVARIPQLPGDCSVLR